MVTTEELVETYPVLYHMAEDGSWPSIQRHGLLSTAALLDLFEVRPPERSAIMSCHRPDSVTISHPLHGMAVIRDQKPMTPKRLETCLEDGLTPQDWYELINRRVFFWLSEARLLRLLSARAYRHRPQTVLHIDTRSLVKAYEEQIMLTPINSGNTFPVGRPRGRYTFMLPADYPFTDMVRRRGREDAVAELSITYAIPDIKDFVIRVERRQSAALLDVIKGT